jgi:DNA-directed RNA polymerase alpha subunit
MSENNEAPKHELLLTVNLLDYESVKRAKDIIHSIELSIAPKPSGIPVDDLDLTIRASNCLSSERIYTIDQLCSYTEAQLYTLQNMGRKTVDEIKDALRERGLRLKR